MRSCHPHLSGEGRSTTDVTAEAFLTREPGVTGEFGIIERLRLRQSPPDGQVWAGDDVAIVPGPAGALLLAADATVAGVHADLSLVGVDDMGWKALVANLSDIAAVGGRPTYALVTLAGPLGNVDVDLLYDGLTAASDAYGCPVVGGDLSDAPTLVVAVAIAGDGGTDERPPVLRSGARPGDGLWVTGPLGSSAAGLALLRADRASEAPDLTLAHRRPRPRLAEGAAARAAGATAMIDVSDGMAADVGHLARCSGVGVVIDRVPVAIGVSRVSDQPETLALSGGEDYELVFAAPDVARVEEVFSTAELGMPIRLGHCTADATERRLGSGELPTVGWEHKW